MEICGIWLELKVKQGSKQHLTNILTIREGYINRSDRVTLWDTVGFFQIGQMHGGFLGQLQTILSKCSDHIWFERSESKDRALITQR